MKPTFIALLALCLCLPVAGADKKPFPKDVKLLKVMMQVGTPRQKILAPYFIAASYESGDGVEKDLKEAEKWFRKAAEGMHKLGEKGDVRAQIFLGRMYLKGHGVKQSFEKSMLWLLKAAVQGDADAQYHIGTMLLLLLLYLRGERIAFPC